VTLRRSSADSDLRNLVSCFVTDAILPVLVILGTRRYPFGRRFLQVIRTLTRMS